LTAEEILELIERSTDNDDSAFEELVQQFQLYAFALAFRLLRSEEDAQDVVQEAFLRVWKHIGRFDRKKRFTTWLYSIVTNLALDRIRSLKRNQRLFFHEDESRPMQDIPDGLDLFEVHSNKELAGMIEGLTAGLPLKQRVVFTLRDLQDLSVEEVAEITKMSVGSVKTNLCYARRSLRKWMFEQYRIGRLNA
jgi:RNA polymerase sigma-70 factor (ECF subfamily)